MSTLLFSFPLLVANRERRASADGSFVGTGQDGMLSGCMLRDWHNTPDLVSGSGHLVT